MLSEKDSEELIFNFRKSLNRHISSKKNPDARNACIMNITRNDGKELLFFAYSSAAGLSQKELSAIAADGFELVPDVSLEHLRSLYACRGMGQWHTEPRLINFMNCSPGYIENVANVLIISEIDCCATCLKYTIEVFRAANGAIDVYTDEYGKVPSRGISPNFKFH